jgi:hypothetical protein
VFIFFFGGRASNRRSTAERGEREREREKKERKQKERMSEREMCDNKCICDSSDYMYTFFSSSPFCLASFLVYQYSSLLLRYIIARRVSLFFIIVTIGSTASVCVRV